MISRSFPWLLLLGIALRCVALNQPLIDAHNVRQCQTSVATEYLRDQGGWPLSTKVNWLGDSGARLLLEMPIYNYLVIGLDFLIGRLDMSGKLVAVLLWGVAFFLFDRILQRFLTARQRLWADFMFVISPLGVFFGQAFMPETLMMVLGFGTILAFLRYQETDLLRWLSLVVVLESLGLVVKATESAHLMILMGLLVLVQERHRALMRLRYWGALVVLAIVAQEWRVAMSSATSGEMTQWMNLGNALGTLEARFNFVVYARIFCYVALLAVTPLGLILAVLGFVRCWWARRDVFLMAWVASLVGYYLAWGPWAASSHSYYNLPSLPIMCAFFGVGASALAARCRLGRMNLTACRALLVMIIVMLLVASAAGDRALFHQDRNVCEAALRLRALNHDPQAMALVVYNQNRYDFDHGSIPTLAYYAGMRTWCHHSRRSPSELAEILGKVQWVVVVKYTKDEDLWFRERTWYSNRPTRVHDIRWVETNPHFERVDDTARYVIYRAKSRD